VRRLATLAAVLALAGCYHVRFVRPSASAERGAPREKWHHGFVGGAFDGTGPVDLAAACPDGFARVDTDVSFIQALGQLVTSGGLLLPLHASLWTPSGVSVVCALPSTGLAPGLRKVKLVLLPLVAQGGVAREVVAVFDAALAGELRKRPGVSVLAESDLVALLGVEKKKEMIGGCTDQGCLAELGGALGAERVIHGSVGRVGSSLVVTLATLDAPRSRTVASVSERFKGGSDEAFLDALPSMVDRLLVEPRPAAK
jgi:hypothetical protein